MVSVLAFIVLLGVLITAHELGHFVVAKMSGVKVQVFSIGFGRALLSKRWGETEYRISALPLGGYVKMLGMDDRDEVEPQDEGRGLLEASRGTSSPACRASSSTASGNSRPS